MKDFFIKYLPLHARGLGSYADLFAMGLCLFITSKFDIGTETAMHSLLVVLLVIGIKESAILNNIFTAANLTVIAIVIVAGFTKVDFHNWNVIPDEVSLRPFTVTLIHARSLQVRNMTNATVHVGKGGFFPFGIEGTLAGAATCFYAFVGFDLVATTGKFPACTSLSITRLFQAKKARIHNEPFQCRSA